MRAFSLRSLQENCGIIEKHVLVRRYVTPDELDAYRPGSPDNPGARTIGAWVHWYAQLVRFAGREDQQDDDTQRADAAVLDALRAEPQMVTLTAKDAEGRFREVAVHPKSLDALLQCHAKDRLLGWLAERVYVLQQSTRSEHIELLEAAHAEIAYQYAVLAWIVTTPGPRSPIPSGTAHLEPPDEILDLEPWDFLRIAQAHAVVNAHRMQALESLISKDTDGPQVATRPSWSIFVGDLAIRMETSEESLMKDRTLGGLLSAIKLHGSVQRDIQRASQAAESAAGVN